MKKRNPIRFILAVLSLMPGVAIAGETNDILSGLNNPEQLTTTPKIRCMKVYDTSCTMVSQDKYRNGTWDYQTVIVFNEDNTVCLRNLPYFRLCPYMDSDYPWIMGTYDEATGRIQIEEGTVFGIGRIDWFRKLDKVESALIKNGSNVSALTGEDLIHSPLEFVVGEDGSIEFDNRAGTVLMGYTTGRGEMGNAIIGELTMTESSLKPILPPAGLPVQQYQMSYTSIESTSHSSARRLQVVVDGNDMYIQGFNFDDRNAWVKGKISGDNVTFEPSQYMLSMYTGTPKYFVPCSYSYESYAWEGGGYGNFSISLTPTYSDITFNYNSATGELTTADNTYFMVKADKDQVETFNSTEGRISQLGDCNVFCDPVIRRVPDQPQIPCVPVITKSDRYVTLDGSAYDINGNLMHYAYLYFRVWINDEPHVFSVEDGSYYSAGIFEPTTDLPFSKLLSFDTCNDFQVYRYTIYFNEDMVNPDVRAEVVYRFGEEEENSVRAIFDQPEATSPDDSTYDLSGRRVSSDGLQPGIYVRNGRKIIVRK